MGMENELTAKDIKDADAVILAISVAIEGAERFEEKFEQKKVLKIDPAAVIKSSADILTKVENL